MTDPLTYLRPQAKSLGPDVVALTKRVLTYPGFTTWTGSIKNRHHYGEGGLLRHTYEVVYLCMRNAAQMTQDGWCQLDSKTLFLAALYHDVGKVHDYVKVVNPVLTDEDDWVSTPHHRRIHHINRSAAIWMEASLAQGCDDTLRDNVFHCILSHHGSPERGSPVLPQTREAWVLHLCDAMSAWMSGVGKMDPKP